MSEHRTWTPRPNLLIRTLLSVHSFPLPPSSAAASAPMFTKRFDSAIEVFIFRSVYLSTYIQLTIHISATHRISHINFLRTFSSYFKIIVHKYFSKFMEFFRDLCLLYTVMSKLLLFPYRGTTFRQKIYLCSGGALK